MIEVEIKVKVNHKEALLMKLEALGFVLESMVAEEDRYFDNAAGQISGGHQALRIRKVVDPYQNTTMRFVTFKDKKLDDTTVTRPEYETEIGDSEAYENILNALGYQEVKPWVRKVRQSYVRGEITICVDEVEGLGSFIELEKVIPEGADMDTARAELENLLVELGLSMADTTRKSYLSQLMGK